MATRSSDATSTSEERLRRLEDRLELLELPARYARAIDDRDIPTLIELFCEDGAFVHANGRRSVVGRQAIEQYYRGVLADHGMTIHVPHMQVIDLIQADRASGWVTSHAELAVGTEYRVVALRYQDDYERVDGRWRFKRRELSFWYFANWRDLAEVVPSVNRMRVQSDPRPVELPESLPTFHEFIGDAAPDRP